MFILKLQTLLFSMYYLDLQVLLNQARKDVSIASVQKNIQIRTDYSSCYLFADAYWLLEAIKTLLANAIEYAPENSCITLNQSIDKEGICIEIGNEAQISQALLEQSMFRRFASSHKNGHFGIGLHMARQIIERHFGRLEVIVKEHQTVFQVRLPFNLLEIQAENEKESI